MTIDQKNTKCAEYFLNEQTDVVIYSGGINRDGYEKFCNMLLSPRRKNLLLVLSTYGGDPDAGYRIARAAIHHYGKNFRILIPSYCKSAGTLICIGANGLVMADQAELGPLDVQLRKENELFQQSSGLDILRGVTYLQTEALQSFKSYLLEINGGSGLSTKIASEISSKLVIGLYEPLFAQVDPVKLGEMNSALQIAMQYGERLNAKSSSLKREALNTLIMNYPTHGFVIDRSEARELFERVDKPNFNEQTLCEFMRDPILARSVSSTSATVIEYTALFTSDTQQKDSDEHAPPPTALDEQANNEEPEHRPTTHDDRLAQSNESEQSAIRSEQDHAESNESHQS